MSQHHQQIVSLLFDRPSDDGVIGYALMAQEAGRQWADEHHVSSAHLRIYVNVGWVIDPPAIEGTREREPLPGTRKELHE